MEQLKGISKHIGTSDELPLNGESVVDMSKLLLEMADELQSANNEARENLSKIKNDLDKSDEGLSRLFESLLPK